MIYHNSKDPVLVKKISINLWFLRDEIEAEILERISTEEVNKEELVKELMEKYSAKETADADADADADDSKEIEVESKKETPLIKRVRPTTVFNGQTILTEIHMDKISFFSDKEFIEGQSIVIEFLVPKKFILNADIKSSRLYNHKSRVISSNPHPYRNSAELIFTNEQEKDLLRSFLASIEPEMPEETTEETKNVKEADNFDDLADFDF